MKNEKTKIYNNEDGQVLIIVVLAIVALMGIAALVVDVGILYVEKANMQNAADAAALAGVQNLPEESAAIATAKNYGKSNGADITNSIVTADQTKIEVECIKNVKYSFARVLGFTEIDVSARAVAQKTSSAGEAFNYAVFAGAGSVSFNGSDHNFGGNVYGRDSVTLGNKANVTGNVVTTSKGSIDTGNNSVIGGTIIKDSPPIAMPDFSNLIKKQGIEYKNQAEFDTVVNGKTVDGPIYVEGNITINGRIKGDGIIYASGTITFLNDDILQTSSDHILFYAEKGSMTFNGGSGTCVGILYAPNGTITVNGGPNCTIYGRIIAKSVNINGAKASVYSDSSDLNSMDSLTSYKLVE